MVPVVLGEVHFQLRNTCIAHSLAVSALLPGSRDRATPTVTLPGGRTPQAHVVPLLMKPLLVRLPLLASSFPAMAIASAELLNFPPGWRCVRYDRGRIWMTATSSQRRWQTEVAGALSKARSVQCIDREPRTLDADLRLATMPWLVALCEG